MATRNRDVTVYGTSPDEGGQWVPLLRMSGSRVEPLSPAYEHLRSEILSSTDRARLLAPFRASVLFAVV